jgi:hypothetical protein
VVAEALHLVDAPIFVAEAHLLATMAEDPTSTMMLLLLPGLYVNFAIELATPLLGATKVQICPLFRLPIATPASLSAKSPSILLLSCPAN